MPDPTPNVIKIWHRLVQSRSPSGLKALLAHDVVFYSPVVLTPQVGKAITLKYPPAALTGGHVAARAVSLAGHF